MSNQPENKKECNCEPTTFKDVITTENCPIHKGDVTVPVPETQEEWEKEFDLHFFGTDRSPSRDLENQYIYVYAAKKFIRNLLSTEREKIVAMVKGLEKKIPFQEGKNMYIDDVNKGYNQSLSDVISMIKEGAIVYRPDGKTRVFVPLIKNNEY